MPTSISGVEARIAQARERHQELHRSARQDVADWRTQAARLTTAVGALNERQEALDTKANAALALSVLAATASIIALKRR
jgi:hypothetical protein